MSASNGVIRIGRKGLKKFAIGEENDPRALPVFEVDVVVAFQNWLMVDDEFRPEEEDDKGNRSIPIQRMGDYHEAARRFTLELVMAGGGGNPDDNNAITTAEALDFIARLRECYDELADFFRPKLRREPESQGSSEEASLVFSEEKVEN